MVNFIAVTIAAAVIGIVGYFIFYKNKTAAATGAAKPSYAPFSQWDINKTIPKNHYQIDYYSTRGLTDV